jgi:hypothetical protein
MSVLVSKADQDLLFTKWSDKAPAVCLRDAINYRLLCEWHDGQDMPQQMCLTCHSTVFDATCHEAMSNSFTAGCKTSQKRETGHLKINVCFSYTGITDSLNYKMHSITLQDTSFPETQSWSSKMISKGNHILSFSHQRLSPGMWHVMQCGTSSASAYLHWPLGATSQKTLLYNWPLAPVARRYLSVQQTRPRESILTGFGRPNSTSNAGIGEQFTIRAASRLTLPYGNQWANNV